MEGRIGRVTSVDFHWYLGAGARESAKRGEPVRIASLTSLEPQAVRPR